MYTRLAIVGDNERELQVGDTVYGGYNVLPMDVAQGLPKYFARMYGAADPQIPGGRRGVKHMYEKQGLAVTSLEKLFIENGLDVKALYNVIPKDNLTLTSFVYQSAITRGPGGIPVATLLHYLTRMLNHPVAIHYGVKMLGYKGRVVVLTDRQQADFIVDPEKAALGYTLRSENALQSGTHRKVKGQVFMIVPAGMVTDSRIVRDVLDAVPFNPLRLFPPGTANRVLEDLIRLHGQGPEAFGARPYTGDFGVQRKMYKPNEVAMLFHSHRHIIKPCMAVIEGLVRKGDLDAGTAENCLYVLRDGFKDQKYVNGHVVDRMQDMDSYDIEWILELGKAAIGIPGEG